MGQNYIRKIAGYLQSQEKKEDNTRLGLEIEHFILWNKTGRSVTYGEKGGIRDMLHWFEARGWKGHYEKSSLISLSWGEQSISLEPGAQLEFSTGPAAEISTLTEEYTSFLRNLYIWTELNAQSVANCGYQPVSKISDIPLIPKYKYQVMDRYFRKKGKLAHNMMRGTGSTQVTVDYTGENDFLRKLRLAVRAAPVLTILFSNCSMFEGQPYRGHSLRSEIWRACDDDRCGMIPGIFSDGFGYEEFAEYLLGLKPIVYYRDGEYIEAGERSFHTMLTEFPPHDFEATLSEALRMVFTDVRVKQFLELRMVDSLPAEKIWMYASLVKNIFYREECLQGAEELFRNIDEDDIAAAMAHVSTRGLQTQLGKKNLSEYALELIGIAGENPYSDTADHMETLREAASSLVSGQTACA